MIETDKIITAAAATTRDLRRGASRFLRQIKQSAPSSDHNASLISPLLLSLFLFLVLLCLLFFFYKFKRCSSYFCVDAAGDSVSSSSFSSEKFNNNYNKNNNNTKEIRIKKLSAVNKAATATAVLSNEENYEMGGCDTVEREEQSTTSGSAIINKRFKIPRKQFWDDPNGGGVDHVSVPRKLRSAMKKRNRESISPPFPDSKKLNHSTGGVESSKRVGVKKSKLNLKQGGPSWSIKQTVSGPITKDEEEVVETLYALAGMFPDSELDCKTKIDGSSSEANPSALPEAAENYSPKLEDSVGIKEDLNAICPSRTDENVNPAFNVEKSLEEFVNGNSLIRPSICEQSHFPSSETLQGQLDTSVSQVNLYKTFVKHEENKSSSNAVNYRFPPGPRQDIGKLKQHAKLEIPLPERKSEIALGLTTIIGNQLDHQHLINESKSSGPTLWPGLSSTVSSIFCYGPSSQSSAAKIPEWLGTATRCGHVQNDPLTGKGSKVLTDRRSWKRCAAHVYIGRLIRALKMPESKESLQLLPNQLGPHEILKQGVLMTINDFNGIGNDLNRVTSASRVIVKTEKNFSTPKSCNLQQMRLHQDQLQPALSPDIYASQKQGFNFLSLSAGGGGMGTNNSFDGAPNASEPLAQLQVPHQAQHATLVPISMSQAQYMSAYTDQPSAAAAQQGQLQLTSHFSSPYYGPHASPKALSKQQQQQQQCLWAAQLASQYRNIGTSTAMTQFPSWQNGRQESPTLMPCVSPSPSSAEVLVPKYPQISLQQQQQFMAIMLPHAAMKRQDHHLSSVYEENGVGFRAGGSALPLQLLCNERI